MSDLINTLTPQIGYTGNELTPTGNINGFLDIIVYAHNYNDLDNKPSINNVTLTGNKTPSDLGLAVPADITVNSVNSKTGDVVLDGTDIQYISGGDTVYAKIVQLENEIAQSGVLSVNGETGIVILDGNDIEYSSGVTINQKIDAVESEIPTVDYPVTSVNGETGAVVLDGTDIEYSSGVTINQKIDAVESEIPTVDYPVTSVNELTGDVELTAGDIPLGSDFSDPTSTAGAIATNATAITTKADKPTSITITPESGVTLVYNSSGKIDKLVNCSCAFEKTGGWASGWQKIATISSKPNATITVSVTNASNGGAVGMGAIYDSTGEIRFYAPSAGSMRIAMSFCYST